jgi:hypothetical protein
MWRTIRSLALATAGRMSWVWVDVAHFVTRLEQTIMASEGGEATALFETAQEAAQRFE